MFRTLVQEVLGNVLSNPVQPVPISIGYHHRSRKLPKSHRLRTERLNNNQSVSKSSIV